MRSHLLVAIAILVSACTVHVVEERPHHGGHPRPDAPDGPPPRTECGPGGECPPGMGCAMVMCIRAPCPSYCHPLEGEPPPPEEQAAGAHGATCGTRGA